MTDIAAGPDGFLPRDFRIGLVLSRSISIYARNSPAFTLIAGIVWLPFVFASYYTERIPADMEIWGPLMLFAFALALQPLGTAIILHGAFQDMRGRPVKFGESIAHGLVRFPAILAMTCLMSLAILLGMALLIVPGVILLIVWYVAAPACVVEKLGAGRSLKRSQVLTRGHRWKLFGLFLLTVVLGAIGDNVLPRLAEALSGAVGLLAADAVWQGMSQALFSVIVVVAYHDLRVAREGIDIEQIASVFD